MRSKLVGFDDFVTEDYFKDETKSFWYVWGDVFNRHKRATPHKGYKKLSEIIDLAGKRDKYFVYHSGVDKFYMQSNTTDGCDFSPARYVQAKGALVDWQCKSCNEINRDCDK